MVSQVCYESGSARMAGVSWQAYVDRLAPRIVPSAKDFHEVWENNFDEEFNALLQTVLKAGGRHAILAMDMEFPGFLCEHPRFSSPAEHYQALRCNVDQLWPIQFGIAVMGTNGVSRGVWTFNLRFDASIDKHAPESLEFLSGIDFPRHRMHGIDTKAFGRQLADSSLVRGIAPCWLTFSGSYDWGYLLKLVTLGCALPSSSSEFDRVLAVYCPQRRELRDFLPPRAQRLSLEKLGSKHGVKRWGTAHTAGSDALLTLDLFVLHGGLEMQAGNEFREASLEEQSNNTWNNAGDWYPSHVAHWHPNNRDGVNDIMTQTPWGSTDWIPTNDINNDWYSSTAVPVKSSSWYMSEFQPWMPWIAYA